MNLDEAKQLLWILTYAAVLTRDGPLTAKAQADQAVQDFITTFHDFDYYPPADWVDGGDPF